MENKLSFVDGSLLWPEEIVKNMTSVSINGEVYQTYKNMPSYLYSALKHSAGLFPDKLCIIDDFGQGYSYNDFLTLVDNFSNVLYTNYHVQNGDHVALLMYNSIEFCVSFFALNRLRAVSVPFPTKYKRDEIFSLIDKSDLNGIICDSQFFKWFHQDDDIIPYFLIQVTSRPDTYGLPVFQSLQTFGALAEPKPEDTAIIMFTSGTTSLSKGVTLANYNVMHAVSVYQKIFHITESDSSIIPVPIYHVTGLIGLLGLFIFSGGCVRLHKFFDAARILSDIKEFDITFLHGAPTAFFLMLAQKEAFPCLPSLRSIACGSSNMPKSKIKELHDWLPDAKFYTVYGLTETSSPATIFPGDAAVSPQIGSSGLPIPGTYFKICDEMRKEVLVGTIGSILIKGTVVLPSYYKLDTPLLTDHWLDTGDLGYFNEDGYLFVVDRKKDMINRGGEKVCSFDVENALYGIPGISEAAVVGIDDETYGESPAAMVAMAPGFHLTQADIQELLKGVLAKFKIPVKIIIADTLPLTPNSKIDKKKIRQLLSNNNSHKTQED